MPQGAITTADREFVETWENIAPHGNAIIRLDVRGEEKQELIQGPRRFMLTTAERIITQDRIIDATLDPFLNGSFRPIQVPETINIETNPNAISDDEVRDILVSSELAFAGWMEVLDSPDTLQRMLDLAPDTEVSLKRTKVIERRLHAVKPQRRIVQKDQEQYDAMTGMTPPAQAGTSGRSSRYRPG